jgi:PAS domain S-box-containing protein
MNNSPKDKFRDRKNNFSQFWAEIVETRFVLCIITALFSLLTPDASNWKYLYASIALYAVLNLLLGFVDSSKLQLKRIQVIPSIIDVLFVSLLVYLTGGQSSLWFLFYLFPIISVSKYLSYEGTVPLTVMTVIAYTLVTLTSSQSLDIYSLILKCLVFLGIALVAGNLTRARQRTEDDLIETIKKIDSAILNNDETDKVLRLILEKALELTSSDMGQMKVFNDEDSFANIISIRDGSQKPEWNIEPLTERYCAKVFDSKKPLSILRIRGKKERKKEIPQDTQNTEGRHVSHVPVVYIEGSENTAGSALFVPLISNEKVKAIIALFSKNRFHYLQSETLKLESFAQLLGIALKNSEMYQAITNSEIEKKERLRMLYEIGEQLKVEQGILDIFRKVVELTYNRLNSEEAALFILSEENKDVIEKVAVKGPTQEITEKLSHIEKPYKRGEGLIGQIFQDKRYGHLSQVPSAVEYYDDYSKTLPSKKVCHYIGVPLVLGEEVLGVIRVINKRSPSYSVENENFTLSAKGFGEEDVELMQTIASQVASAIRSAKFIEVQRYYQELVANSPDPIIMMDKKGKVKVFNKACETIWGFSADEVIGKHITNYYESERHARDISKSLEESPSHRIQDYPAKIRGRSGEIIPISLSASLLFNEQGGKIGSIGVFKDFREILKLQEEKTNAERLATLGKLAHTIGHEIKHDIATALNYIDTLAYESTDDEELSEIYRDVQESLSEAIDKFQNMLMVGRPRHPERKIISAEDIFRSVEVSMRRRAGSRGIEFLINYPDDHYELSADIAQLRRVLLNLFDNSIDAIEVKKYSGAISEKGRIELSAQASNGDLQITWKDNGCGISPQSISKIFTPFVTDKTTGNGLGLFIIKSIIENHGGNISVESEEGSGTRFEIAIPLQRNVNIS